MLDVVTAARDRSLKLQPCDTWRQSYILRTIGSNRFSTLCGTQGCGYVCDGLFLLAVNAIHHLSSKVNRI